jgi:hypothetical protein
MKEIIANYESKMITKDAELLIGKESVMLLEVERELRSRSEYREEAERRERIAANAQLMAIQTECISKIRSIEEKNDTIIQALKEESLSSLKQRDDAIEEARRLADLVTGLENEVHQLHSALENASTNHESLEKLGRVTGELEILKKRMKEINEMQVLIILYEKNNLFIFNIVSMQRKCKDRWMQSA